MGAVRLRKEIQTVILISTEGRNIIKKHEKEKTLLKTKTLSVC